MEIPDPEYGKSRSSGTRKLGYVDLNRGTAPCPVTGSVGQGSSGRQKDPVTRTLPFPTDLLLT